MTGKLNLRVLHRRVSLLIRDRLVGKRKILHVFYHRNEGSPVVLSSQRVSRNAGPGVSDHFLQDVAVPVRHGEFKARGGLLVNCKRVTKLLYELIQPAT